MVIFARIERAALLGPCRRNYAKGPGLPRGDRHLKGGGDRCRAELTRKSRTF